MYDVTWNLEVRKLESTTQVSTNIEVAGLKLPGHHARRVRSHGRRAQAQGRQDWQKVIDALCSTPRKPSTPHHPVVATLVCCAVIRFAFCNLPAGNAVAAWLTVCSTSSSRRPASPHHRHKKDKKDKKKRTEKAAATVAAAKGREEEDERGDALTKE